MEIKIKTSSHIKIARKAVALQLNTNKLDVNG